MADTADTVPDASEEYHLWDELFTFGLQMALAGSDREPENSAASRQRLARGFALALKERDEMWQRLLRRTGARGP